MKTVKIIAGKYAGKEGTIMAMMWGAGMCMVKLDDGEEVTLTFDEIDH